MYDIVTYTKFNINSTIHVGTYTQSSHESYWGFGNDQAQPHALSFRHCLLLPGCAPITMQRSMVVTLLSGYSQSGNGGSGWD